MNKIVREHYPVSKLPEELRAGFERDADVRVVIENSTGDRLLDEGAASKAPLAAELPITRIFEEMQDHRVFNGDPVDRVRALRAEWDYRDELHDRIRRGDDD